MKSNLFIVIGILVISLVSGVRRRTQVSSSLRRTGPTFRDLAQEQRNKEIVAEFYTQVFGQRNLTGLDKFFGSEYIQHNPLLGDGQAGFLAWIQFNFPPGTSPFTRFMIEHIGAEGNWVWIHVLNNLEAIPVPKFDEFIVDIYRLKDGRLVEHFDVIQFIPNWSVNSQPIMNSLVGDFSAKCAFSRF